MVIVALHPQLEKLADGAAGEARIDAQGLVDGFTSPKSPHTKTARGAIAISSMETGPRPTRSARKRSSSSVQFLEALAWRLPGRAALAGFGSMQLAPESFGWSLSLG
jgi:hypothetical protein